MFNSWRKMKTNKTHFHIQDRDQPQSIKKKEFDYSLLSIKLKTITL